jgi:2-hydroxychromene-2-carboxylate isomerase
MHSLEFFFDCSSPWTYLAFESVQKLKARIDFDIVWRPILVGGVFNQVNPSVYENRAKPVPVKARYYQKDLRDWAHYVGVTIGQPPVFPVNSVKAMRGAFVALEHGCLEAYARRVFHRYWGDLADISQDTVLSGIVSGRRILRQDRNRYL